MNEKLAAENNCICNLVEQYNPYYKQGSNVELQHELNSC